MQHRGAIRHQHVKAYMAVSVSIDPFYDLTLPDHNTVAYMYIPTLFEQ